MNKDRVMAFLFANRLSVYVGSAAHIVQQSFVHQNNKIQ